MINCNDIIIYVHELGCLGLCGLFLFVFFSVRYFYYFLLSRFAFTSLVNLPHSSPFLLHEIILFLSKKCLLIQKVSDLAC